MGEQVLLELWVCGLKSQARLRGINTTKPAPKGADINLFF